MIINPSTSEVEGSVRSPASKSMTHRALLCSALSRGISKVQSPLISDDTLATRRVLTQLGVNVIEQGDGWRIMGGSISKPSSELFCGESGTTLRLSTPVCGLAEGCSVLTGGPSLSRRPMKPLLQGLKQLGVKCESSDGHTPVIVWGKGSIQGGVASIRGDISSQFVSGLLFISPLTEEATTIKITTNLESKPYVNMTIEALNEYGIEISASEDMRKYWVEKQEYRPMEFKVEGDWSSASYMLAAGALTGDVTIRNLNTDSNQADKTILDILDSMDVELYLNDGSIRARKSSLSPINADLKDSPDIFPIVAALCACSEGESRITGIRRLRFKESDRVTAMINGLNRMGIKTMEDDETIVIKGGKPKGGKIDPFNDHRIAMAFAVLALNSEKETTILDSGCVSKSYPGFWKDFEALGVYLRSVKYE